MRTELPTRTVDVLHTDSFVFQRDPRSRRWTCYRASDGFEVGTDDTFEDSAFRASTFEAFYTGELF